MNKISATFGYKLHAFACAVASALSVCAAHYYVTPGGTGVFYFLTFL